MSALMRETRARLGVTLRDADGRWHTRDGEYGYAGHFTGAYICYTCGALCECGDTDSE